MRPSFRTKIMVRVECNCGYTQDCRNGVGVAARHFAKCGQYIRAESSVTFIWDPARPRPEWATEKAEGK